MTEVLVEFSPKQQRQFRRRYRGTEEWLPPDCDPKRYAREVDFSVTLHHKAFPTHIPHVVEAVPLRSTFRSSRPPAIDTLGTQGAQQFFEDDSDCSGGDSGPPSLTSNSSQSCSSSQTLSTPSARHLPLIVSGDEVETTAGSRALRHPRAPRNGAVALDAKSLQNFTHDSYRRFFPSSPRSISDKPQMR